MKTLFLLVATLTPAFAALPSVGPDYTRPSLAAPATWRDKENSVAWKTAEPAEHFARGEWWKIYADSVLDDLQSRALAANQDLRAAAARVQQARAAAGLARSNYWPQL